MEIIREQTKEQAKIKAGLILQALLKQRRSPYGVDYGVLFLSSGGSSLELLESVNPAILDSFYTIAMLDERFSADEHVNNFAQLARTLFYRKATIQGVHWIDTRVREGEALEELEERFEGALRAWKTNNPLGRVVATFGMGPDGHIAGMMPYPEHPSRFSFLFENPSQWVISYDATKEKSEFPLRATTTMTFLRTMVDCGVCTVTGQEKENAFERLLALEGTLSETPARILREMKNISVVTDIEV